MLMDGYLYIVLRGDFIENKQYIYKVGETQRYPPHRRLWDYCYGSIFLTYIKTNQPLQFEKELKAQLNLRSDISCVKEIGIEYFQGSLTTIIDLMISLYPLFNPTIQCDDSTKIPKSLTINPITQSYLLRLNRVHYLVNYDQNYFDTLYKHQICCTDDVIPSEEIYKEYQKFRQWHADGYPDNYVIRHGMVSFPPNKSIKYHVTDKKGS
jgi:hypothetical protein